MDTGLGVCITLNTDSLARTFARAGVGLGALTANGQAAHVPDATIAFDTLETLEVHAQFAAQITFDDVFAFLNRMHDLGKLLLGQILRADGRINVRPLQNFLRVDGADAIDVAQRDINALVGRYFHSDDACHKLN